MTYLSSRYQYDCIVTNDAGEPLAKFRRGAPAIFETEFCIPLEETVLLDQAEVLRLLRLDKRPWKAIGRRPEVARLLYNDRHYRIRQLEFAKAGLAAWHEKPHRIADGGTSSAHRLEA